MNSRATYFGICLCFLLSGFAALLYQTAWMRQFSTVFGTSELAVATVLSAYMGGLAFGAAIAGKFINFIRRPVLTYGVLEAAIAVSALLVPVLLTLAKLAYANILGGQPEPPDASGLGQSIFYFVVAFIVLAIPTACMGATLPLLTRYAVTQNNQIGSRVGALYAINTAGAVLGTIVAAFLLLPKFGLMGTVWFGVAVNFLVFLVAAYIAKKAPAISHAHAKDPQDSKKTESTKAEESIESRPSWIQPSFILPIMLMSGTTSFVYEVLWTRLLSHILGGSVAAFATMLASFLSGIAIGSAIASRFAATSRRSVYAFVVVQIGIALTSIAIYQWLHLAIPAEQGLSGNVGIAIAILLPATLFIGATFPLAVRIFSNSAARAASSSAQVYSWNTVGAIFGAAFAGFFLIPALKYEGAIKVAVLINVLLALAAATLLTKIKPLITASIVALFVGLAILYKPLMPEEILRSSPIESRIEGDILFYEVGRSSTVLMTRGNGSIGLRNNGLPEAGAVLKGAPPFRSTQDTLATLPGIIRPDAKSMLIVGLGGGNAVNGVPPSVETIDVIELEPRVIDANQLAADQRVKDPLADPRLTVYINDARSALSLTAKQYDAIISQPSHPWTAGASHLYTREYMALAEEHLSDDGVFLQWMAGQFVSEALLRSLCATMLDVFEYVKVYHLFPEVFYFVGSQSPMDTEQQLANTLRPIVDNPPFYYSKGIVSAEDLLAGLLLDTQGARDFSAGADLLTDNFNRMATDSAGAAESGANMNLVRLSKLLQPYVPVLNPDSWVYSEMTNVNFAYISNKFEEIKMRPYSIALARALETHDNWQSLLLTGMGLERQGERDESQRLLIEATTAANNDNLGDQARYALLKPWLRQLARGSAPNEAIADVAETLTGPAAAVFLATGAAQKKNWTEVAALDPLLSQSRPTDLWFVEATKLMVEWRNNLARIEKRSELAEQASRIIDLAIAVHPVPDLYALRISSAYFADRPDQVLETARGLADVLEDQLDRIQEDKQAQSTAELQYRHQQVNAILAAVQDVSKRHNLSTVSVDEVTNKLEELLVRIRG